MNLEGSSEIITEYQQAGQIAKNVAKHTDKENHLSLIFSALALGVSLVTRPLFLPQVTAEEVTPLERKIGEYKNILLEREEAKQRLIDYLKTIPKKEYERTREQNVELAGLEIEAMQKGAYEDVWKNKIRDPLIAEKLRDLVLEKKSKEIEPGLREKVVEANKGKNLTNEEIDEIINKWTIDKLVPVEEELGLNKLSENRKKYGYLLTKAILDEIEYQTNVKYQETLKEHTKGAQDRYNFYTTGKSITGSLEEGSLQQTALLGDGIERTITIHKEGGMYFGGGVNLGSGKISISITASKNGILETSENYRYDVNSLLSKRKPSLVEKEIIGLLQESAQTNK